MLRLSFLLLAAPLLTPQSVVQALQVQRRRFVQRALFTGGAAVLTSQTTTTTTPSHAAATTTTTPLTNDQLREAIRNDILQNQFLVTGRITKSLYRSDATFTDEIDTYQLDQWVQGTARLFRPERSHVRLIETINVTSETVQFRFDEDLCFNLPLLYPVVSLTGTVILQRDPETGLIASYREVWDQDVATVLRTVRFFSQE